MSKPKNPNQMTMKVVAKVFGLEPVKKKKGIHAFFRRLFYVYYELLSRVGKDSEAQFVRGYISEACFFCHLRLYLRDFNSVFNNVNKSDSASIFKNKKVR
jgi:hypothetical protein